MSTTYVFVETHGFEEVGELFKTFWAAGTITNAAKVLKQSGAREIYVCATHAVFSPPAIERLSSGNFHEVICSPSLLHTKWQILHGDAMLRPKIFLTIPAS